MKHKILLAFFFLVGLNFYFYVPTSHSFSTTPPTNRTGAPGQNNCSSCHGTGSTLTVDFDFDNGNSNSYIPGNTYDINLSLSAIGKQRFGFSMLSWDDANNWVGSWASGANNQVYNNGKYIGHENAPNGQADSFNYDFQWTAPASGTGTVNFYAGCVAANGNGNTNGDEANTFAFSIPEAAPTLQTVELDLHLLLEGPYQSGGVMSTAGNGEIPNSHPFSMTPYSENPSSVSNIPANAVDWVLIELRSGQANSTAPRGTLTELTALGFLLSDGSVIGTDGQAPSFAVLPSSSYYIAVRQRNHLDVMSASKLAFDNDPVSYDFRMSESMAFGNQQLKVMNDGFFALHAGDYNQDQTIQTTDYDEWQFDPAIINSYAATDGNLDGVVSVVDFDRWFLNKAKIGSHELNY